ncbi:MAG: TolB family protein [Actinomycetota bacterium]
MKRRSWRWGAALLAIGVATVAPWTGAAGGAPAAGVTLAFSSYRHHVGYPRLYLYRHNGDASGALEELPATTDQSDFDPYLTSDGRLLAYNIQAVGKEARLRLWDVAAKRSLPTPSSPMTAVDMAPCVTDDGKRMVSATLFRPGPSGWNLLVQEVESGQSLELPGLNSDADDRMPSLSGDGRWLAFASSRPDGAGLQDIYLYDVREKQPVALPGLNSASRETEPSLSADGRWLTFVSTRPKAPGAPAGSGDLDVYLYDLRSRALTPLPGLNGAGPDQSPALSPDGRYLAFVSERFGNAGGRDVYLYDRATSRLLPTPGLNSTRDDMDPALAGAAQH